MTTTKTDKSMAALAEILKSKGFKVGHHAEACGDSLPLIRFDGDDDAGDRAAMIAMKHGYALYYLKRCWQYLTGRKRGPYWTMEFSRSYPKSGICY